MAFEVTSQTFFKLNPTRSCSGTSCAEECRTGTPCAKRAEAKAGIWSRDTSADHRRRHYRRYRHPQCKNNSISPKELLKTIQSNKLSLKCLDGELLELISQQCSCLNWINAFEFGLGITKYFLRLNFFDRIASLEEQKIQIFWMKISFFTPLFLFSP